VRFTDQDWKCCNEFIYVEDTFIKSKLQIRNITNMVLYNGRQYCEFHKFQEKAGEVNFLFCKINKTYLWEVF